MHTTTRFPYSIRDRLIEYGKRDRAQRYSNRKAHYLSYLLYLTFKNLDRCGILSGMNIAFAMRWTMATTDNKLTPFESEAIRRLEAIFSGEWVCKLPD